MSVEMLRLFQLADSIFPSGGFAFSNGLECMARQGNLKGMDDFHQYLECYLEQLATLELPYLNSAFAEAKSDSPESGQLSMDSNQGLTPKFILVARDWNAWLFLPAQRRGSLAQGTAWLHAIEETYAIPAISLLRQAFLTYELPLHFLMVLASTLSLVGIGLVDAQNLLLHMALRDQLGAAVRLGLLGSLQAQKMHYRFASIGDAYRSRHADWTHVMARRSTPMIELAQVGHANLYSKLFQS